MSINFTRSDWELLRLFLLNLVQSVIWESICQWWVCCKRVGEIRIFSQLFKHLIIENITRNAHLIGVHYVVFNFCNKLFRCLLRKVAARCLLICEFRQLALSSRLWRFWLQYLRSWLLDKRHFRVTFQARLIRLLLQFLKQLALYL